MRVVNRYVRCVVTRKAQVLMLMTVRNKRVLRPDVLDQGGLFHTLRPLPFDAEIDDGLAAETLADGSVRVWIHIADPSRWISPGSPLAAEAERRGATLYLPTGAV